MEKIIPIYRNYKSAIKAGVARYVPQSGRETFVRAVQVFRIGELVYRPGDPVEIINNDKNYSK